MTERLRFKVEGMDCASCARKIETAVTRIGGVSEISVNTMTEMLSLSAEPGTVAAIEKVVRDLGYPPRLVEPPTLERAPSMWTPDTDDDADEPESCGCCSHDHGDAAAKPLAVAKADAHEHDHGRPLEGAWWKSRQGLIVIASGALIALAFLAGWEFPSAESWIFTIAALVAAVPVVRRAVQAARHGSVFTIEMLMTIAVAGALMIGEAGEAAVVVFLFACGELLEGIAAARARAGIRALAGIAPKTAQVETARGLVEMPVEKIAIGATVVVRPGDKVPADGIVLSGNSAVDESALTGESMPRSKREGDQVFAGAINQEAMLRVRVEKPAADTLIARVVRLVEEATEAKAPTERFIDRFSRFYMPIICGLALVVAVGPPLLLGQPWEMWVYRGLTLLLIGCPCALVISVPAAVASGLAAGARRGLLVKGGNVLEQIGRVKHIAFDKTGTLTEGKPKVTAVRPLGGMAEGEILRLAAAVESASSHPLAAAIVSYAKERGVAFTAVNDGETIAGKGVSGTVDGRKVVVGAAARLQLDAATVAESARLEAEGRSVSAVVVDGAAVGLIALRDEPREDTASAIAAIKALGLTPIMLTGDNKAAGEGIGRLLGIEVWAELLPEDKLDIVKRLAASGGVATVGDGINDAPALAAATVGIAMGSGTDVALEAADAAVLRNRIGDVAALIRLSRRTMGVVRQNIWLALGLKAIFLVTTIFGFTGLWIAILADTGATVLVTGNALKILNEKAK
jgi:Cd2+/Zn2+-exporting ATPase